MKGKRSQELLNQERAGFTLIELMIVVAIIAILAMIATGLMGVWVKKSKKAEAKTNLSTLAVLLEEYNSLYGRYCIDCTDTSAHTYTYTEDDDGVATADTITNWLDFKPKQASSGSVVRYDYAISATSDTLYTVTATPVVLRGVLNDTLTLDQDGVKTDGTSNRW